MPVFIDQTGRSISINKIPKRIISLVPSQTELLFDLGLNKEVVGITKFCVYPKEWFQSKPRIGGTKQIKLDIIHQLEPDLIIANKEENVKEQIEELEKHYSVWISDVNKLDHAYEMISQIGLITARENLAEKIISKIKNEFSLLSTSKSQLNSHHSPFTTCYLIWQKPYMTIGGDTFIHSMLESSGFENIYSTETRYPEITIEEIKTKNPDLLFLSSEPFPFKQKHIAEWQTYLPDTKIILVDGEFFSWYGSRLLKAPAYFNELKNLIHH